MQEVGAATATAAEANKTATQAKLDATRHAPGATSFTKSFTKGYQGTLESKAVSNLPLIGSDRVKFHNWNDRMINAVSHVRPGSKGVFKKLRELAERGYDGDVPDELTKSTEGNNMTEAGCDMDRFNDDLHTLLTDKTEGEAASRVRSHQSDEGVLTYITLYKYKWARYIKH